VPSIFGISSTSSPLTHWVRLALSVSRLHIVVIAALGTFTFGWIFTGQYPWLLSAVCALDWFLVNLLNRVVDLREDEKNGIFGTGFVARHRRGITALGLGLLATSLVAVFLVAPAITPLRVAYHLLGLAYNWALPGRRRIKELYLWKNTASATGFLLTVFGYPLAAAWWSGGSLAVGITVWTVVLSGLFFFLFELSYEVIYDLRDAEGDAAAGVQSFPVVHGEAGATRIIDGLIAASAAVLVMGYAAGLLPWKVLIMIFAPLLQLVIYKRALRAAASSRSLRSKRGPARRGITTGDCIGITWLGAALLLTYHLWVVFDLPGARF